ncbi:hypothetical protein BKG71_19355 [Mycobacteroides chelonae]|uniref:hypothetical protein n=1 Tax=Mycobacteroides chelonae TaxID=1774 RepID=UPI0008A85621|nr:hypothetical protein [Mycobacteroides chelonae]OHT98277.1 hypothetical protein BKG71_19355 [Mycobacteroides chelonae]
MSEPTYPGEVIKEELWRNIEGNELSDKPHRVADKILEALESHGYAVVKLPEPDVANASFNSRSTFEWFHPHGVTIVYEDGETEMVWWPDETEVTADSLRVLAATCLAAAAESETTLAAADGSTGGEDVEEL